MGNHHQCFHCGAQNRDTAHFCRYCGRPFADQPARAPQPADELTADITAAGRPLPVPEIDRPVDPPPSGSALRPGPRRRPWWPLPLTLAVVFGLAALAGWQTRWPTAVFGVQNAARDVPAPYGSGATPAQAAASGQPSSGGASTGTGGSAQQQAANSLASLLSQSVSDRNSVNDAYNDVLACGPTLSQDAQTFQDAVQSRQQLISQLTDLPSQSALSPSMLQDLSSAWQASVQVDSDYVQWAQDQASGCIANSTTDPSYVAAENPNRQATEDKTAFASQWDPVAAQYGLTQYQQGDL